MNNSMLALIDATSIFHETGRLTDHRPIGAVPFYGRYRLIDFTLSSLKNSGVRTVAVYPKRSSRSLRGHVGNGKTWELHRNYGGFFFLPSTYLEIDEEYFVSYKRIEDHIEFLEKATEEYVIISNSYALINIDYRKILDSHIESNANITSVIHDGKPISIYLLSKRYLLELVSNYELHGENDIAHTIKVRENISVNEYIHTGYTRMINSIDSYFKASMELLETDNRNQIFNEKSPIYTRVNDSYPTRYIGNPVIENSIVTSGCSIEGGIKNSILGRYVKVGKNSIVENSVLLEDVEIGSNCIVRNAILDKNVYLNDGAKIIGTETNIQVLPKNYKVNN